MNPPIPSPRPSATLVLVRDAEDGLEVFMLKRAAHIIFAGNHAFPGGSLDPSDDDPRWEDLLADFPDAEASRRLGLERGGRAYWLAAVRECFEETGLLLACDSSGRLAELDHADIETGRAALATGELDFADFLRRRGLRPALDRLLFFNHWISPVTQTKRFDTRFFLAAAPESQTAMHDPGEAEAQCWIRPRDALNRHQAGEIKLIPPTLHTLEVLARHARIHDLMHHAAQLREIPALMLRLAGGRDGPRKLLPGEPAYAEVSKLDPRDSGTATYEIIPGVTTVLSPRVRRLTAPNAGYMTGPGTNSYLLGSREVVVIDPGPANAAHVEALLREAGAPIRWILATHTHFDHSPGAALLKARTGAQVLGMAAPADEHQDRSFAPDIELHPGQHLELGDIRLRVIHTPGHASNHACYLFEEEKLLFTGDHIMQGSTVVINPPDGDMIAYLASLRMLLAEDLAWLAPGHGFLMDKPAKIIEHLIAHRLGRENKVLQHLAGQAGMAIEELLPHVYDDVPAQIHPVARRSLLAHLLKLAAEGRAREDNGLWSMN